MSSKRIEWIDIAKGMGMLLVIMGHALPYGGKVCNLIFSFHMPLFFILSGMVYKDITIKDLFVKRARSLLLPYLLFCILGTVISLLMGEFSFKGLISDMYYGNPEHIYVSSVWYLIALFAVIAAFSLIRMIKNHLFQYGLLIVIMGVGFAYGFLYTHNKIVFRMPLDLDVVPVALAFFACGFYSRTLLTKNAEKMKNAPLYLSLGIIVVISTVFAVSALLNHSVNLHAIIYHNPVLYIIASLTGSLAMILICAKLAGCFIAKPFVWVGQNTIYFLGAQAIGIRLSVAMINSLFSKEFTLYGLPYSYAALAFVATTAFSIVFTIVIKSACSFIRQSKGEKIK